MAPFQKVGAGEKIRQPSATERNAFIDAALDYRQRARSALPSTPHDALPPGMIRVRNDSGADRARYDALAIGGVLASTSGSAEQLRRGPCVTGVTPAPSSTPAHGARFVVLDEPIKSGQIGRAWIDGQAIASVDVSDVSHTAAKITSGHKLSSAATGPVRLVWAPATGVQDCLVVLGAAAAGELVHAMTPVGGIAAMTGLQMESQTCAIYDSDSAGLLSDSGATDEIYNPAPTAIGGEVLIGATRNGAGILVAIVEGCTSGV